MTDERLSHIVILNDHGFINGGAAKVAIESALWLRSRGLGVSFVAGSGPMDDRLAAAGVECVKIADHDVHGDPDRRRAAVQGLWNKEAARVLARHIHGLDPRTTVVHLHTWSKALSPSVGPVLTASGIAHVCTLHEYFLACPNGAFYDYTAGQICTKRALGASCLATPCDARRGTHKVWRLAREAILWSAGRMPRGLREIIYLSPKQRSVMDGYFDANARWHHLPNAVGVLPDDRISVERNDAFLFVGRISPEKGAIVAALAARAAGVRLVFAGEGSEREAVRKANPEAELLGWLGQEEVDRWMRQARCLVFPSLWYEGYPLVVADALRLGVPVLVSDNTVATSLISDGVNGLHVRAGDVEAWSLAMLRLGADDTARRMGEAAFRSGQQLLSHDQYTDELIAIYERVLSRNCQPNLAIGTRRASQQI